MRTLAMSQRLVGQFRKIAHPTPHRNPLVPDLLLRGLVGNFFGSVSRLQKAATAKGLQWLKDLGHRAPLTVPPPVT